LEVIDLNGKRALIVGVADERSIAAAVARKLRSAGAEIALTYHTERSRPYVEPFAQEIGAAMLLPCNVPDEDEVARVIEHVRSEWGAVDYLFHAVGAVPKYETKHRLVQVSGPGFAAAMQTSVYSFIQFSRAAAPLLSDAASIVTLTFYGAERVVDHYNVMGPVKAALQCAVQYPAHELGPSGIRVNAISAGPIDTRASSGISQLSKLADEVRKKAPLRRNVTTEEVGKVALFLVSDLASGVTGEIIYVDSGHHIEGVSFEDEAPLKV
jgi:enoyl-[acyl-carrier protein] reductase I